MKRNRTFASIALISALAAWAFVGCEQSTGTDTSNDVATRTQSVNLNDPYGGYNTANEKAGFGDPYLLGNYGGAANNMVALADSDTTRDDHMRIQRFLLVTWGNLQSDSTITSPTDWSGSLCAENGIVRPLRTIRFEYPRDHLVPGTSRSCVDWVSHTEPHFDGILFAFHHMPCDSLASDSLCAAPLSITFTTGPLTVTFNQDELKDLHKVIKVDDAGNAVAFNTIVREPHACPNGFLAGQWKDVPGQRYAGIFRGEWTTENGLHSGFLHGVYGQNREGHNVFFAKWITDSGAFHGLMRGTYGEGTNAASANADGWFSGVWISRELRMAGNVKGVWGQGSGEDGGGFFRGVWGALCR
ncbi:MAG TPA: hypothetical protein VJS69_12945 [Candidatus Krumholzibacteria bacterium]|nr:hypothetical protein [Candidatus Krumholzibacteria bacterium]